MGTQSRQKSVPKRTHFIVRLFGLLPMMLALALASPAQGDPTKAKPRKKAGASSTKSTTTDSSANGPLIGAAEGALAGSRGAKTSAEIPNLLGPTAPVLNPGPLDSTYQLLSTDLAHDIVEFDQLGLDAKARRTFAAQWLTYLKNPAAGKNPFLSLGNPFQGLFTHSQMPSAPVAPATVTPLNDIKIASPSGQHSMQNPALYASQRLGPILSQLIHDGKIQVEIYGGTEASLAAQNSTHTLKRIPSLYEKWGIGKYLDMNSSPGLARVIIAVPPMEQYATHYGVLVKLAGGTIDTVRLNPADRAFYMREASAAVGEIYKKLNSNADYVILGYADQIKTELALPTSPWKIAGTPITATEERSPVLSGSLYTVVSKKDPTISKKVLTLSAAQTIWGEGSVFLVNGVLNQNPELIGFMGSAGGPGKKTDLYDVTVPAKFLLTMGQVQIHNDADYFHDATVPPQVKLGVIHGNTNSPAEQTRDFISGLLSKNVDTIDVEEGLVANAIATHNKEKSEDTVFSGINVVTDKPSVDGAPSQGEQKDLSKVDQEKKMTSKKIASKLMIKALHTRAVWEKNIDAIRAKKIALALPGVDPKLIKVTQGQGKVDADPKRKLSYFVFTENPLDPQSKTILIPMATSRFDRYNYMTDEWWDANKDKMAEARAQGIRGPRQDPEEVAAYLEEHDLSVNPDVLVLDNASPAGANDVSKVKLRDFLLNEYLTRYSDAEYVYVYRGAEKPNELETWQNGEFPHGVRYWTPDAQYAWRYGRKNPEFTKLLLENAAPLFKYKIPRQEFIELVNSGQLVLGTELTKHVHDAFDQSHRFIDQLTNDDYLGDGKYGLELEIRARGRARERFPSFFDGAITIDDLADSRIRQIKVGTQRLMKAHPDEREKFEKSSALRILQVEQERKVLKMIQSGEKKALVLAELKKNPINQPEITNTDGDSLGSLASSFTMAKSCMVDSVKRKLKATSSAAASTSSSGASSSSLGSSP